MVGTREGQQSYFLEAGGLKTALDDLRHTGDRTFADRAGDHAGLAKAAAACAAPEDLDAHALVHRLRQRNEGLLGVGPFVEVHQGVLANAPRDVRALGCDALDAAVR